MAMCRPAVSCSLLLAGLLAILLGGCSGLSLNASAQVRFVRDTGHVKIHQMGGNIDVRDAPKGVDLATMGGSIHVGSVGSRATVKTMGGDIRIDYAQGPVNASTMGGKITIGELNGPVKASTMAGDIAIHMIGSSSEARDIDLDSKSGTITVIVPKDFPMQVSIRLAYTQNQERTYRIVQQLGLKQQTSTVWDSGFGTPRKYIFAAGQVGNGSNRVTINTINGDVILKQE